MGVARRDDAASSGGAARGVPAEWLAPSTLPSLKEVAQSSDTLLAYAAVPLLSLRGGVRALSPMREADLRRGG